MEEEKIFSETLEPSYPGEKVGVVLNKGKKDGRERDTSGSGSRDSHEPLGISRQPKLKKREKIVDEV